MATYEADSQQEYEPFISHLGEKGIGFGIVPLPYDLEDEIEGVELSGGQYVLPDTDHNLKTKVMDERMSFMDLFPEFGVHEDEEKLIVEWEEVTGLNAEELEPAMVKHSDKIGDFILFIASMRRKHKASVNFSLSDHI